MNAIKYISVALMSCALGYYLRGLFIYDPPEYMIPEVTHMCSCISDNPEHYNALLKTSANVNKDIARATQEFIANHGLRPGDFGAVLVPEWNGGYSLKIWSGGSSASVSELTSDYSTMIRTHTKKYDLKLRELHDQTASP